MVARFLRTESSLTHSVVLRFENRLACWTATDQAYPRVFLLLRRSEYFKNYIRYEKMSKEQVKK